MWKFSMGAVMGKPQYYIEIKKVCANLSARFI